ncbi:lipopolysaccharide biosynthesis protein [Selenomonas ruminantium]|uniref:lipopolysaccharide biosynthesis protein n=1 Tax=Selenomonas ruminantium TaxID=971 RepID=UPI0026EFD0FF|nr:oligosaccharide flippase family protein [Selenomonas ruminantium]
MKNSVERTKTLKKNIKYSILFKAISVVLSFLLLPLTVNYLSEVEYGIWVTIFSILTWVNIFDMGIGLGLRNKIAAAIAKNDFISVREYLSTGISVIILLSIVIYATFLVILNNICLQEFFNTSQILEHELYCIVFWAGTFVIVAFILSIINQVYYAYQKAAITGAINIIQSLVMLGCIYYLITKGKHDLIFFVYSYGLSMLISRCTFIFVFFRSHKEIIPSMSFFVKDKIFDMTSLGLKFFIIQLCCLFCNSFNNILITKLLGPEYVRDFDVIFKIINASMMIQTLIMTPLWSAYTQAYALKDYLWIKKIYFKSLWITLLIAILFFFVTIFIDPIIFFWMHITVNSSYLLPFFIFLYNVLLLFDNAFSVILNGIGLITIQMYAWIVSAFLVIPLSYIFIYFYGMKAEGIAFSMILSLSVLFIILPLQIRKIFKRWKI